MSNELPGEWGDTLGPKGVHSYRDVAAKVTISAGTAHRLMTGGPTSVETVNKVADALFDGDRDAVWRLRGSSRKDYGDWALPADASLLDPDQRDAIIRLVQVMVPKDDATQTGGLQAALDEIRRQKDSRPEPVPDAVAARKPGVKSEGQRRRDE